jgi:hypothetical protein
MSELADQFDEGPYSSLHAATFRRVGIQDTIRIERTLDMSHPARIWKATAATTTLVAAAAFAALALASPASAKDFTKFIAVDCPQPYSQVCSPRKGMTVDESSTPYYVRFTPDARSCAPGVAHIFVDGTEEGHSDVLVGVPAQFFDIEHGPGSHTIDVQMDGKLGGCNTGAMSGWGGTLLVQTDRPAF